MQPAAVLRDKINRNQITLGVLATDHLWPQLVEICKLARLDYLIVDCEHGPHDEALVAAVCQAGRLLGFPVLIRPISCAYDVVRRAIDMGPCGLLLPSVEQVRQLDMVRDAVFLPPRGRRRPGGWANHRRSDCQYATWKAEVEDNLVILPQIESLAGLECASAIAAHELVTAVAVGPYDLSAELGCCWQPDDERLQAALRRIRAAGRAAGKNMWMIGDGPTLVQRGYTFICIGDPSALLAQRLGQLAAECLASGAPAESEH
jgi:2-keto-3-deoxy-L-rhamnonate aldolase RhmA